MTRNSKIFLKLAVCILVAVVAVIILVPRETILHASDRHARVPMATDWSHHHMVYSTPKSSRDSLRLSRDPRFLNQWTRRHTRRSGPPPRHHKNPTPAVQPLHKDWSEFVGTATSNNAANYPAKFSFDLSTADCAADFVSFTTGQAGSATQPTIVAFNNLYSGCTTGTVPNTLWAYSTGTGSVPTAPMLSLDGTKVAFVETAAGGATLRLIKYANGEGTFSGGTWAVAAPTASASWSTGACAGAGSCMISIAFGDVAPDTNSSPFYDYNNDILYVGDDAGTLHKFSDVFGTINPGTPPAEVVAGGWPVILTPGNVVTSPVYDGSSGNVIASDSGGIVYEVASANGATINTGHIAASFADGPIVDGTTEEIYAFAADNLDSNAAVFQFSVSGLVLNSEAPVGDSSDVRVLYAGDFDNAYYSSLPTPNGNLYVCGNLADEAQLYQIPITGGVMSVTPTVLTGTLTLFPAQCGPVTEIFNPNGATGPTDWLFSSVQNDTVQETTCSQGGCLMNLNITPWQMANVFPAGQHILDSNLNLEIAITGGTSGGAPPVWNATVGGITADGGVVWLNQGQAGYASWLTATAYTVGTRILDPNGFIQQVTVATGSSGATQPAWIEALGNVTLDNAGAVVWTNLGPAGGLALQAPGGASGVVVDNFVSTGTLPGTSQIYYLTLAFDFCANSNASGGCAVQASQSGLQ